MANNLTPESGIWLFNDGDDFFTPSLTAVDPNVPLLSLEDGPVFGSAQDNPGRQAQRGLVHFGASLLLTTLAVVASTAVPRAPLFVKPAAQQAQAQPVQGANLALLTAGVSAVPFNQAAQANPILARPPLVYDSARNLLLTTLAGETPAPFAQTDWPNPQRARQGQHHQLGAPLPFEAGDKPIGQAALPPFAGKFGTGAGWSATFIPPDVVAGSPFTSVEQTNPQRRRSDATTWVSTLPLPFDGGAKPFSQSHWPNPAGPQAQQQPNPPNLLGNTLAPSVAAAAPRQAIVTRYARPPAAQQPQYQNQILPLDGWGDSPANPADGQAIPGIRSAIQAWTLPTPAPLLGAAPQPFRQTDWPNPQARPPARADNQPSLLQAGLAPLPIGRAEVPRQFAAARQTAAEQPRNLLVGTQPFFGAAQSNPVRVVGSVQGWILPAPLPFDAGDKPFLQSEWPVPKAPSRGNQDHAEFISPALAAAQPSPFAQVDWPNPVRRIPAGIVWLSGPPLPLDGGGKPFAQTDWSNPVRAVAQALRWTSDLPVPLDPGLEPFSQSDWPNPTLRVPSALTWAHFRPIPFDGGAQPLPSAEFANPRGPTHARQPKQLPALLQAELQPLPVGAVELPRAAGIAHRQQPVNVNTIALTVEAVPGSAAQPNPPRSPNPARTWTNTAPLPADGGQKPFLQTDWPNPRGPSRPVADFCQSSPLELLAPVVCPTPADIWGYQLEGGYTAGDLLELMSAVLAGKTTIADLGSQRARVEFRAIDDSAVRVAADMIRSERAAMTLTPGPAAPSSGGDTAAEMWNYPLEGGYTARDVMRLIAAVLLGKTTITGSGTNLTATFRAADDSADRVQAQINDSQRTNVTLTP